MYKSVIMGLQDASGVLEANPTLVVTNHLRSIEVPVLVADATATAGVEGVDATAAETDGGHVGLDAYRYDGKFTVSAETVMSADFNVDQLMSTYASRCVAAKVAEMLAVGNNTGEPNGLFTAATVGKTTASSTVVTPEEMIDLTKSVGKAYRKNASLIVSDALHTQMLQWRTDDGGGAGTGSFVMRSLEGGGYQFAGCPVYVEPQADQGTVSAAEVHAVFGDPSGFIVRTTPMLFAKDESNPLIVVYRFAIWMDCDLADAGCVRSLITKA
jgi:HK97 family phage major capsid protein